jgi:peptide/nickel transport system substrate-binding protein
MSRRVRATLVTCGLLAMSACGSGANGGTASKPPADKILRLSFLQDPGQPPDPDIYYAGQGLLLTTNIYEGLLRYAPGSATSVITGLLAKKWTASKDNRVFTLQLREGVKFHDGTPFTAAAVKPSFDRRLAVNQGPAYMVSDVASVTTKGDYTVTITLKQPDSSFLAYLASPYGPRMMSPTVLKDHAGKDHAQTWLRTHDAGTGPYTLTDARVGSHYALKAFAGYWGTKPYFTGVDIPVVNDGATQQLEFDRGQLAAVLHDLSISAVQAYRKKSAIKSYPLPTMQSIFMYVNPRAGILTSQSARTALLQAVDLGAIAKVFTGRGQKATQAYPPHMIADGMAAQNVAYQPAALQNLVKTLPSGQKTLTIGYDTSSSDLQVIANLVSAELRATGLTAKVQGYPTSEIYGWSANPKGAPAVLMAGGWPDAPPPYTWAHINFGKGGGLNYMQCSVPALDKLLEQGKATGDPATFSQVGQLATASGCWYNLVDLDDFMVAQPWLKGVPQAHSVSAPFTLDLAALSAG